jgi:hypothetical protein
MRRSISSRRAAAALALVICLAWLAPLPVAADDGALLEAGRTAGRGVLLLRDPKVCAIALLRDRCRADVDVLLAGKTDADFKEIPKIGPHPASGLRAFVTNGDRDGFDNALGWLNSRQSTAEMWRDDARAAALYDAGIEDVLLPAAQGVDVMELLGSGSLMDLFGHAAQIPHGTLPVEVPQARPDAGSRGAGAKALPSGAMIIGHGLVAAIDVAMPAPPLTAVTFTDGIVGDAALGVASSTVAELIDSPPWLFQADAQRFVEAYTSRLAVIAPVRAAQIADFRAALRGTPGFSHDAAIRKYNALIGDVMQSQQSRAKPLMLGAFAAQLTYNAVILRDRGVGTGMWTVISQQNALDQSIAGWHEARLAADAPGADWAAQYRLGLRLVNLIGKANHP